MNNTLKNLLLIFSSILFVAILEIIFSLLPTSQLFNKIEVNEKNKLLAYEKNEKINFSHSWKLDKSVIKQTNNYGFINSIDYHNNSKPDLMVIGDSFVDAYQVENKDSISEKIAEIKKNKVYSLSMSGSALSQYLFYMKYAEKNFNPKEYLFVLVDNDFHESICEYYRKGRCCFNKDWELN